MEKKQTKKIGKGAIYYNNPQKETQPKYKGNVTLTDGNKKYEFPVWFNGTITDEGPSEGFNIGFEINEVLNPAPPKERPVTQDEAKEGWQKVKEAAGLNEGEPPKEEDDVPF
tara:strand:+ start:752 stop:1087 length:336 start_codon:yes stop_codon:yes gene_type:complete